MHLPVEDHQKQLNLIYPRNPAGISPNPFLIDTESVRITKEN